MRKMEKPGPEIKQYCIFADWSHRLDFPAAVGGLWQKTLRNTCMDGVSKAQVCLAYIPCMIGPGTSPIVTTTPASGGTATTAGAAQPTGRPAKMHHVAQQFEAMFMTEMLRMAHPSSQASGVFAAGVGETTWRGFMDQALGQALAANGHTGLTSVIEKALNQEQQK